MSELSFEKLHPDAAKKIKPFLDEVIRNYGGKIHSIYVTGTSITEDYDEKVSDVNSVFVLNEMDLRFLELIAPLGRKYGKHRIAAPLIMTPDYIRTSLDVFPVEFLSFKLLHSTVYGKDILNEVEIDRMDLRRQCERDLKTKLIMLRQGYISSQGDRKILTEGFAGSITGYIPLFRGIIMLSGNTPPSRHADVITALGDATNVDTRIFMKVLREKHEKRRLSIEELNTIFEDYYTTTEKLGTIVDELC